MHRVGLELNLDPRLDRWAQCGRLTARELQ